jgi:hypothetical protein
MDSARFAVTGDGSIGCTGDTAGHVLEIPSRRMATTAVVLIRHLATYRSRERRMTFRAAAFE